MPAQDSRENIRLRGEKTPLLVLIGFTLAGLVGSIITAWLLLPNLSVGLNLWPPQIADTSSATLKPLPVPQVELDEVTVASDLVDDTDAPPDEEADRSQVKEEVAQAIELAPAAPDAPKLTMPDNRVDGIEAVDVPASGGPNAQFSANHDLLQEQAAVPQAEPGATMEGDKGLPLAEQKHGTPDSGSMESGASSVTVPDSHVSGSAAIGDPEGGLAARSAVTLPASEEPILEPEPDPGLLEEDERSPLVTERHETPGRDTAITATVAKAEAVKSVIQSTEGDARMSAGLEQTVDEAVPSDCAPLFPVTFSHGDARPQIADMRQKVEGLAAWLVAHPSAILSLDGHADASGPAEFNLLLSYRRAAAVAALLEDAGTSNMQLVVRAHGEGQSSSRSADAALERRVALTVDVGEPCGEPSIRDGGPR